jgi:hypothetical protein
MNKERDLLPWILGSLLIATAALAVTAVATKNGVTSSLQATAIAAHAPPVPISQPAPSPAPNPVEMHSPAAEPDTAADVAQPEAPGGQIWECTTRGVKTFSNNPCGDKSTLLDIGPINTMQPTPVPQYARAYNPPPHYASGYTDPGPSYDQDDYSDQAGSETGGDTYTIVQGGAFVPRRHPLHQHPHPHRPPYHHGPSGPMPKKN